LPINFLLSFSSSIKKIMRSSIVIVIAAVLVGVALSDCPRECSCQKNSEVCYQCKPGFHNVGKNGEVFCCSDSCGMCQGTPDFCISCPLGMKAVDGDCIADNEFYSSGAASSSSSSTTPKPPSSSTTPVDEGLKGWEWALIGVAGAIVLIGIVIGGFFLVRYCLKTKGPSIGVHTGQHDVLFDDDDEVDLAPVDKKKKPVDDDAFI